jgi:hypothetical protein
MKVWTIRFKNLTTGMWETNYYYDIHSFITAFNKFVVDKTKVDIETNYKNVK